jgi:hypothetical protein
MMRPIDYRKPTLARSFFNAGPKQASNDEELISLSTAPTRQTDPYGDLPWNLSNDDRSFSWIRVDEKLDPRARQLVTELERTRKRSVRYGKVTYGLSTAKLNGTRFLHRKTETTEPNP